MIGLACVAVLLAVVIWGPHLLVERLADTGKLNADQRLKADNDLRATLVTMFAGIAVVAGTVVAALNFINSRDALEDARRQNEKIQRQAREQLELQRLGQVNERFTKAIDQLGQSEQDKLDVRLGAIYALEQIARDSKELHPPILESSQPSCANMLTTRLR